MVESSKVLSGVLRTSTGIKVELDLVDEAIIVYFHKTDIVAPEIGNL